MKILKIIFPKRKERRKYARINVHHNLKYKVSSRNIGNISFARNLSAGGVLLYSKNQIFVGEEVELEILSLAHSRSIRVKGKVVRVRKLEKIGYFEVGVEFLEINPEERDFINKKILQVHSLYKEGGRGMLVLAVIFLTLAFIAGIGGFLIRFFQLNLPVAPVSWTSITSMFLLFAIAIMVLIIVSKK